MTVEEKEALRAELVKQLVIGAVMVLSLVIATLAERQASGVDPMPTAWKAWWDARQERQRQEAEFEVSWRRLLFGVYETLGPGCLA